MKENFNINNKNNNNKLELSNIQQILNQNKSNNISINDISLNKNIIRNNLINNISNTFDPKINLKQKNMNKTVIINKPNTKKLNEIIPNKENKMKIDLEILNDYDQRTLYKKISQHLDKMYKYYMEIYPYDLNKLFLSNMFLYYCQNERQLKFYTSIF